jgi:hypothetical protein
MEEMSVLMRKSLRITDVKSGWFGKTQHRCAQGNDIINWVIDHVENNP